MSSTGIPVGSMVERPQQVADVLLDFLTTQQQERTHD